MSFFIDKLREILKDITFNYLKYSVGIIGIINLSYDFREEQKL